MTREQFEANPILRWWRVIAVLIAWTIAGLIGFSTMQRDIASVSVELAAHEKAQAQTIEQMQRDLSYIRDRLDRALEQRK